MPGIDDEQDRGGGAIRRITAIQRLVRLKPDTTGIRRLVRLTLDTTAVSRSVHFQADRGEVRLGCARKLRPGIPGPSSVPVARHVGQEDRSRPRPSGFDAHADGPAGQHDAVQVDQPCLARLGARARHAPLRERVDEARLPDVGSADERELRRGVRRHVGRPGRGGQELGFQDFQAVSASPRRPTRTAVRLVRPPPAAASAAGSAQPSAPRPSSRPGGDRARRARSSGCRPGPSRCPWAG